MATVFARFHDKSEVQVFGDFTLSTVENTDGGFDVVLEGNICKTFADQGDAESFEAVVRTALESALAGGGGVTTVIIDDL